MLHKKESGSQLENPGAHPFIALQVHIHLSKDYIPKCCIGNLSRIGVYRVKGKVF